MSPTAGLAALNFFLADVQGGLGPFLATWLTTTGWNPERVGLVMTIAGLAGLSLNSPAGMLVDKTRHFRLWVALASLAVVGGTLATLPARSFAAVLVAQVASAFGGALMAPAVTALTLGIVGKDHFPRAIDTQRASGHADAEPAVSFAQILRDRPLLILGLALLLFPLGNAAMLPLLGQRMAAIGHGDATRWMAACVVVAQFTMVPVAIVTGRAAGRIDRAWLLLAACSVLPIRGVMAAVAQDPTWLMPIQVLDGCGAGTLGVAVPIMVADFTWGTGRTQSALGFIATLQGIGAAFSTTLGGLLAAHPGWWAAFLGLTVPAVFALGLAMRLLGQASSANAAVIRLRV